MPKTFAVVLTEQELETLKTLVQSNQLPNTTGRPAQMINAVASALELAFPFSAVVQLTIPTDRFFQE